MNLRPIVASVIALVALSLTACAGRNIHRDASADTRVMTRGWTLRTHGPYEAGDRGFEYSSPAIYQNTVLFGNQSQGLVALYPGLLRQRWMFPVVGGVVSAPLVDRNSVYFGGGDGYVYSLNAETGKMNWKYEVRSALVSRPTVSNGRLFVTAADDTVYALDAGTGKWLWHYKRRTTASATIHAASTPLVNGNEVLVGLTDGFVVALSLEEGSLKWEKKLNTGGKFTDVDAGPVLDQDALFVPSYDGALYSLKPKNGDILWKFDGGGSQRISVEGQTLYMPSSNGHVYALARQNSKVLWDFELDRGTPTQIVLTEKYAIFASSYQYLYVLEKETGKLVYRYNAGDGSGFSGAPLYDAEKKSVYILSMAGNLYQFNLRGEGMKSPDAYRFDSGYRPEASPFAQSPKLFESH